MKRTKITQPLVRPLRRSVKKLIRTKFPIKNCYVMLLDVPNRYFASTTHHMNNSIYWVTKAKAFRLHKQLKDTYYGTFIVKMKINESITRTLIKL